MRPDSGLVRFARGLLAGGTARREGDRYVLPGGGSADAEAVARLIADGALAGGHVQCRANAETTGWLRRSLLDGNAFAAQHQQITQVGERRINLAESPLARLASPSGGEPAFLDRHHLEAGERVSRLVERAQLKPRLTMAYTSARTAGGRQQLVGDISDFAADARKALAELHRQLPADCAGVVLDVCGMFKGLQEVERDRGWPRRSAKLVLRIGLEQIAQHWGIGPFAVGRDSRRPSRWMAEGARPSRFE